MGCTAEWYLLYKSKIYTACTCSEMLRFHCRQRLLKLACAMTPAFKMPNSVLVKLQKQGGF